MTTTLDCDHDFGDDKTINTRKAESGRFETRRRDLLDHIGDKDAFKVRKYLKQQAKNLQAGFETHEGDLIKSDDETSLRVEAMLVKVFDRLIESEWFETPLPILSARRDGSVDVYWDDQSIHMLVNIPPQLDQVVEYSVATEGKDPKCGEVSMNDAVQVIEGVLRDLLIRRI